MKGIITGARGTVGRVLSQTLQDRGDDVVPWDRSKVSVEFGVQMEEFIREVAPDIIFHLAIASTPTNIENEGWVVNQHWTGELARISSALGIRFVYVSTVMVFSNDAKGPFSVDSIPDATEGYGLDKLNGEQCAMNGNPQAHIVRLGWQIGDCAGSNNMIDFMETQMVEHGVIRASTQWMPATSFLQDTANALIEACKMKPGLYQIDGNRHWNFYQIVRALNQKHGNLWKVEATDDFVYDQRMLDKNLSVVNLDKHLEF